MFLSLYASILLQLGLAEVCAQMNAFLVQTCYTDSILVNEVVQRQQEDPFLCMVANLYGFCATQGRLRRHPMHWDEFLKQLAYSVWEMVNATRQGCMKSPWRFIHKGNERGCFPRSPAFILPTERRERRTRGAANTAVAPLHLARLIWVGVAGSKASRTMCRGAVQDQRTRMMVLRNSAAFLSEQSVLPRSALLHKCLDGARPTHETIWKVLMVGYKVITGCLQRIILQDSVQKSRESFFYHSYVVVHFSGCRDEKAEHLKWL